MQPSQPSQPFLPPRDAEAREGQEQEPESDTQTQTGSPITPTASATPRPPVAAPPGMEMRVPEPASSGSPVTPSADTRDTGNHAPVGPAFVDAPPLTQEPQTAFTDWQPMTPPPAREAPFGEAAYNAPASSVMSDDPMMHPPAPFYAYGGASALPFTPPPAVAAASVVEATSSRRSVGPLIALLGVGILFAAFLALLGYVARDFAARDQLSFELFTLDGLRFWLPGLALALLTGGAVLLVAGRRASPGLSPGTAWIFPFVTMIAGLLVVSVYHDRPWWFVAPIVTGFALIVGTVARLFLTEPSGGGRDVARTMLTIITYVVAFLALAMVYINKLRSIFSATAVVVLCVLLLLQMTDGETASLPRRLVYAIAGGLIVGQVTWVINYWSAAGWTGGAFLLAVFYLIAGLSAAQLRDRIGLFDVIEFGGVALLALAIVSAAVLYQS